MLFIRCISFRVYVCGFVCVFVCVYVIIVCYLFGVISLSVSHTLLSIDTMETLFPKYFHNLISIKDTHYFKMCFTSSITRWTPNYYNFTSLYISLSTSLLFISFSSSQTPTLFTHTHTRTLPPPPTPHTLTQTYITRANTSSTHRWWKFPYIFTSHYVCIFLYVCKRERDSSLLMLVHAHFHARFSIELGAPLMMEALAHSSHQTPPLNMMMLQAMPHYNPGILNFPGNRPSGKMETRNARARDPA